MSKNLSRHWYVRPQVCKTGSLMSSPSLTSLNLELSMITSSPRPLKPGSSQDGQRGGNFPQVSRSGALHTRWTRSRPLSQRRRPPIQLAAWNHSPSVGARDLGSERGDPAFIVKAAE